MSDRPARKGSVRVVSKRRGGTAPDPGETVIDIDRTNPILGNRHILKNPNDEAERTRVIDAHGRDLDHDLAQNGPMAASLIALARRVAAGEQIALRCWCAPKRCHGDRQKYEIERMAEEISRAPKRH